MAAEELRAFTAARFLAFKREVESRKVQQNGSSHPSTSQEDLGGSKSAQALSN